MIQNKAEAAGDLIGKIVTDKISRTSTQNTVSSETEEIIFDVKAPQKSYISLEKKQAINKIRLI